jgi:hypothetical protein
MDQGNLDRAEALALQALDHYQELQNQEGVAAILSSLGDIATLRGGLETGGGYHRQALEIRHRLGMQNSIAKECESFATMRAAIGNAAFSDAWERGVAMTTAEATAEALR